MHSTNYRNTLITPAEDCLATAKVPDRPGTVAALQYACLADEPYSFTSDDVLSGVAADRAGVDDDSFAAFRSAYLSKGQPCFRASPLTKTHGWAVHADEEARVALIDPKSPRFAELVADTGTTKVAAMRNKRV